MQDFDLPFSFFDKGKRAGKYDTNSLPTFFNAAFACYQLAKEKL